jgi:hypothetical protein
MYIWDGRIQQSAVCVMWRHMLPNMSQKLPNPTVKSNNPTDHVELLELECCMLSTLVWVNFSTDTYYSDDEFVLHNSEWLVYSTWNCNTHVILLMNANGRKTQSPFNNFNTIWTYYMACHNGFISSLHHKFELTELQFTVAYLITGKSRNKCMHDALTQYT